MRITNTMVTNGIVAELQQLESQQSSLQTEISSGLAVTQPSDSPATYGEVIEEEGQTQALSQYDSNATQALDVAQASYSGLSSLTQIYDRATQLATLGTGTLGSSANQGYADELNQLIQQAVTTANSQFNGDYLYGGTAVSSPPFTTQTDANGNITSVTYAGNSSQTSIPISSTSSIAATTDGTTNAGIATLINDMISVRDALNNNDSTALGTAATALNNDETTLSTASAENGAIQLRIQSTQTQQQANTTELSTLISNQTAADLPTSITQLSQTQLAYQAALETASKVMQLSLTQYLQ